VSLPPEELARASPSRESGEAPLLSPQHSSISIAIGDLSPDGRYRWDGREWVPLQTVGAPSKQQVVISAGTAFKIGFFGFYGAAVASIVVWILAFIVLGACGAMLAGALRGSPTP
jgi:hypothetical protein